MTKRFSIILLFGLIIEITILYFIEQFIGGWGIFFLIFGTIVLGINLINKGKPQTGGSLDPMMIQQQMMSGNFVERIALLAAGFFLFIPGIITDILGLAILIPPVRRYLQKHAMGIIMRKMSKGLSGFTQ